MTQARMDRDDAGLIVSEFTLNARMALFALRLGDERLKAGGVGTAQLPAEARNELADTLVKIIEDYKVLWLARNRPGGLDDSVERMARIIEHLSR